MAQFYQPSTHWISLASQLCSLLPLCSQGWEAGSSLPCAGGRGQGKVSCTAHCHLLYCTAGMCWHYVLCCWVSLRYCNCVICSTPYSLGCLWGTAIIWCAVGMYVRYCHYVLCSKVSVTTVMCCVLGCLFYILCCRCVYAVLHLYAVLPLYTVV